ncbi:hypothetical protein BGX28_008579 [Mortierella sp. GBA30]|nr:hypothetical protein BGX28_008579 [Mortierella sp. GBA30]
MPPKRKSHDGKDSNLESVILEYLKGLDTPATLSAKDFVVAVKTKLPTTRNKHIVLEWNRIRSQHITSDEDDTLKQAFTKEPILSVEVVKDWVEEVFTPSSHHGQEPSERPHASDTVPALRTKRKRAAGSSPTSSTSQSVSTSRSSQHVTTPRSSASSSSSSTLSTEAILRMDDEFMRHYEEFAGVDWTLPSGSIVDQVLRDYIRTLSKESTLHSFVISQTRSLLPRFDPEDRRAFSKTVSESDACTDEDVPMSEWKKAKLGQYQVTPKNIWSILQSGWTRNDVSSEIDTPTALSFCCLVHQVMLDLATVYRNYQYRLPKGKPEAWYRTKIWGFLWKVIDANGILEMELGEVTSAASSLRKNAERILETKQYQGRKIDGVVICCVTNLEICAMEAGKADQGSNGTKVLQDSVKMAKVLKDMFDAVCSRSTQPESIRTDLRMYGLLVSGLRMDFISFRYMRGRFYRMQTENSINLPPVWDDEGLVSETIVALVSKIISFKERMERMSGKITRWTQASADTRAVTENWPIIATLTTPVSSPRR